VRLTLRTLLAYLDDTLDPAQAKLIGQKVAESEAAQELIARIKQVTRRRRLTTPPSTGPGAKVDANTVAEYLDNALNADGLAEVEEVCMASDVHLAEIAACHQILALAVGEPALVPPVARQRMYGLVKGREAIPYRKPPAAPRRPSERADVKPRPEAEEPGLFHVPGTADRPWLVPLGAAALLAASAFSLFMALRPAYPPRSPDAARSEPVAAVLPTRTEPKADVPPPEKPAEKAEEKPEAKAEEKPDEKPAEPQPAAGAAPKVEAANTARRDVGRYQAQAMGPPSVLLQRSAEAGPWQRLRPGPESRVQSGDVLVSLPGYRSELRLDSGVDVTLWGNLPEFSRIRIPVLESAVVLNANTTADADLTLLRGRIALASRKADGPARVRVRFLEEVWEVVLPDATAKVALELFGTPTPYTRETGLDVPQILVALLALEGQPQLRIGFQPETALPVPGIHMWDNLGPGAPGAQRMPAPPDWWTTPGLPATREARPVLQALEELSKRLSGKAPVEVALSEALKENDGSLRVLAVRCLVAVGDLPRLLDALDDEKFVDVRVYAIEGLKQWLGLAAAHDRLLLQMLVNQKQYTQRQAETVLQLLHGYTEQDAADPALRATLVDYLNHDRLPIRQLAHWQLVQLVPEGQRIRYDAAADPAQREAGQEQWRRLAREGKPGNKPPEPRKGP
jgi:hypothetical protein